MEKEDVLNKKLIIIYDLDVNYAEGLLRQLKQKEGFPFEVKLITTPEGLEETKEEVELLLLSEGVFVAELGKNIKRVVYLSEGQQDSCHMNKYQSIDKVIDYIKKHCEVLKEDVPFKKSGEERLIVVYSPIGGSGMTTLAGELAEYLTGLDCIVYSINFELISSFACKKDVDFFYDMRQRQLFSNENWKAYFGGQGGAGQLTTSLYNNELWNVDTEDILYLIGGLREREEGAYYIFDLGFLNGAMCSLLNECDYWFMPWREGTLEQAKITNLKKLLEFRQMEGWKQRLIEVDVRREHKELFQRLVL